MKRLIIPVVSAVMLMTGCYPDYVRDYDHGAGVYTAYQYDLRSFVIGEDESFDFTVALGGVISNEKDRAVKVVIDNSLLTSDLALLAPDGGYSSFTALDAILGKGSFGTICQQYVTQDVKNAGITTLTPLPESYYNVSGLDKMTISKGRHTAAATIKATEFITEDPQSFKPYYALGFRIESAEDAEIVPEMGFEVIVVRCENKLFGTWGQGGTLTVQDLQGNEVEKQTYDYSTADDKVFTLTTKDHKSVVMTGSPAGSLILNIKDDNTIDITSADGSRTIEAVDGKPSVFNGAKLLQGRKINLNFRYTQDGKVYIYEYELGFRSRTRDGVLEWQDENPENYK